MSLVDWRGREIGTSYVEEDLHQVFGQSEFRPGQQEILEAINEGRGVVGVMPTGSGKSLCYQAAALEAPKGWPTLIVSPLIALMRDQVGKLRELGIAATDLHSGRTPKDQRIILDGISSGRYCMVYLSPERLANEAFRASLDSVEIAGLAVDEAHCLSQWGDAFRPDYRRIPEFLERVDGIKQITAFTATAAGRVIDDVVNSLRMEAPFIYRADPMRPNLKYSVMHVEGKSKKAVFEEKLRNLIGLVKTFFVKKRAVEQPGSVLVYAATRSEAEALFIALQGVGLEAGYYHAGLPRAERSKVEEGFLRDDLKVLVATNAFGMGVDKSNIRLEINFSLPGSVEDLLQQTGRAGRDGKFAKCILFYSQRDLALREYFIKKENPDVDYMSKIYFAIRQGTIKKKAQNGFYPLNFWLAKGRFTRKAGSKVIYDPTTEINATVRMLNEFGLIEVRGGHFKIHKVLEPETPEWAMLEQAVNVRRAVGLIELSRLIEYVQAPCPSQQLLIELMDKEVSPEGAGGIAVSGEEFEGEI